MTSPRSRTGRNSRPRRPLVELLEGRALLSAADSSSATQNIIPNTRAATISASAADTTPPKVTGVRIAGTDLTIYARLTAPVTQAVVTFSEDLDTVGGTAGANSVTNPANWGLLVNAQDVSSRVSAVTFGRNPTTQAYEATVSFSPALTANADYIILARKAIRDTAGNALNASSSLPSGFDYQLPFAIRQQNVPDPEFRVSTSTTAVGYYFPSVAADAGGNSVVTWSDDSSGSNKLDVYAQRYDAAGIPLGTKFLVNTPTADSLSRPAVVMDAGGNFVIAWTSLSSTYSGDVYARRFDAQGVPQGEPFRVNSTASGTQFNHAISMNPSGEFVVTCTSDQTGYGDTYARMYDAAGLPKGDEFKVNAGSPFGIFATAAAVDSGGNFVAAWAVSSDRQHTNIYARRYDSAGMPRGEVFKLNTAVVNITPYRADGFFTVGMDAGGDFVVVWNTATSGEGRGVYARRFDSAGVAAGDAFRVNMSDSNATGSYASAVAMDAAGNFTVVWNAYRHIFYFSDIYARRYDPSGVPLGDEFLVPTTNFDIQKTPAVAVNSSGNTVVAWLSNMVGESANMKGVFAKRIGPNDAPTTLGVPAVSAVENAAPAAVNLWPAFADSTDASSALAYSVVGDTNPALFSSVAVDPGTGKLNLAYAPNAIGTAALTVRATDTGGLSVDASFLVTVRPAWLTVPNGGVWSVTGTPTNYTLSLTGGNFTIPTDPAVLNPNLSISVTAPATLAVNADVHIAGLTLDGAGAAVTFNGPTTGGLSFTGGSVPLAIPVPGYDPGSPTPAPVPTPAPSPPTPGDPPKLAVGDAAGAEGDVGTTAFSFPVTLDRASDQPVKVYYATANVTAAHGSDYLAAGGAVAFRPGETSKTVTVRVKGDKAAEADERFRVVMYGATGAMIADGTGIGTIRNDDAPPPPKVSVTAEAVTEGDAGTRAVAFDVSLDRAPTAVVTVKYATADGTAKAASDYVAAAGTLTFKPGETRKRVTVYVKGDKSKEGDEVFYLNLLGPAGNVLGRGIIRNDD